MDSGACSDRFYNYARPRLNVRAPWGPGLAENCCHNAETDAPLNETPEEFGNYIREERDRIAALARSAGIRLD